MGVAVVNPRDCLNNSPFPKSLPSSLPKIRVFTSPPSTNPKPNRSGRGRPNNRPKRSPLRIQEDARPTRSATVSTVQPQFNQPVMGHVKILKRGELLTVPQTPSLAPVVQHTDQVKTDLGLTSPNPAQRLAGLYAGSSMFVASPPPSSVPLPAFCTKKSVGDPTSDLRRILELEGILGL